MWRKGNTFALLVEMQIFCSVCGKQYGDNKKLKMNLLFDMVIPLLGIYMKEPKTLIQKKVSTPMFIAALFTIAKIWKQPKCPSVDELDKTTMAHLHNGILLSCKKEESFTLCDSMDGPREHYAK